MNTRTPSRRSEGAWRQWISLNGNELTWIAILLGGLFLLGMGR
jgi:hypothetical protein